MEKEKPCHIYCKCGIVKLTIKNKIIIKLNTFSFLFIFLLKKYKYDSIKLNKLIYITGLILPNIDDLLFPAIKVLEKTVFNNLLGKLLNEKN